MYKVPERDKEFGVGKRMGDNLYFHMFYADEIMGHELICKAIIIAEKVFKQRYPDEPWFEYETPIIKYNKKKQKVSFLWCLEFDDTLEPAVTGYITVDLSTESGIVRTYHNDFPVYHHKWLMVKDDYGEFEDFPMEVVKERSVYIEKMINSGLFDIDVKRMGYYNYWEDVRPILCRMKDWQELVLSY
jgi:hypothetical protein